MKVINQGNQITNKSVVKSKWSILQAQDWFTFIMFEEDLEQQQELLGWLAFKRSVIWFATSHRPMTYGLYIKYVFFNVSFLHWSKFYMKIKTRNHSALSSGQHHK